jgi:Outer membrane protein beta-barrel domain
MLTFSQTIVPKVGATLAKPGGDHVGDPKFNLGFTVGVAVNVPLGSGSFSLQPELSFVQKGWKYDETGYSSKTRLDYLELPVLIKATFGEATKFYINVGPSLGLGLDGKFEIEYKNGSIKEDYDVEFGEGDDAETTYFKKTDFGLQFGGGVLVAEKVMIDIRYSLGLSSLSNDRKATNNVLQLTLGIPLNVK